MYSLVLREPTLWAALQTRDNRTGANQCYFLEANGILRNCAMQFSECRSANILMLGRAFGS